MNGDEILSAISGRVSQISEEGNLGKHIKIENENYATVYAHCNDILVQEGNEVKQGDKIATIGNTGNSTGPHLHFEILENGEYVNPLNYLTE